jgi:hypothetical protein
MRPYCKAYPLADIRCFPGWPDGVPEQPPDDGIVYLCDDLSVVADPIEGRETLFAGDSPEWRDFCAEVLGFAVPDDLAFARAERADD